MVSFNLRLYTYKTLDNGKHPIVIQVSWRDKKPNIRRKHLGIPCHQHDWDRDNNCLKKEAVNRLSIGLTLKIRNHYFNPFDNTP